MKVGLTLWGFAVGVREAVELAGLAERGGFDSVFVVEGVFSNDAITIPWRASPGAPPAS
jgi:alkanesulfonate monooxygenase SsuD/methylene tetrahydromethanopterin reductase-like flavin-dependent oxidoreductase (luciferase family)